MDCLERTSKKPFDAWRVAGWCRQRQKFKDRSDLLGNGNCGRIRTPQATRHKTGTRCEAQGSRPASLPNENSRSLPVKNIPPGGAGGASLDRGCPQTAAVQLPRAGQEKLCRGRSGLDAKREIIRQWRALPKGICPVVSNNPGRVRAETGHWHFQNRPLGWERFLVLRVSEIVAGWPWHR